MTFSAFNIEHYRHRVPAEIRFADLNPLGVVKSARCQTYTEIARNAYYTEVGLWNLIPGGIGPIVAKATIEFRQPLRYGDTIEVFTRCIRLGNKSYQMQHVVVKMGDRPQVAAQAVMIAVVYDHRSGHSVALPQRWRENVLAYEPLRPQE